MSKAKAHKHDWVGNFRVKGSAIVKSLKKTVGKYDLSSRHLECLETLNSNPPSHYTDISIWTGVEDRPKDTTSTMQLAKSRKPNTSVNIRKSLLKIRSEEP